MTTVGRIGPRARAVCGDAGNCASPFSLPMTLEANEGQADSRVKFIGRGNGATILLTREGIEVVVATQQREAPNRTVKIRFENEASTVTPLSTPLAPQSTQTTSERRGTSSAAGSKPRARGKTGSKRSSSAQRQRAPRKRSARPRTRRKRAADDRAPKQRRVPHQSAPVTPTVPREHNPPNADAGSLRWLGEGRVSAETNYFIGNDSTKWRTHVGHFSRAVSKEVLAGVDLVAYGNKRALEYDLRVAPEVDARSLRLQISGADAIRIDASGNLVILAAGREIQMQKPVMYEELTEEASPKGASRGAERKRRSVSGGYAIEPDGNVGFHIERQEASARLDLTKFAGDTSRGPAVPGTLVIDPTLSVSYSTFLGGSGDDSATSVAVDSSGKIYVSGTTTSAATFPEPSTKLGPGGGNSDYFIAKIDPAQSGMSSLVYLTFVGGSGEEEGGSLAVDANGNAAIAGTTTSSDFPVTDGSTRTAGSNDATVTEINSTGAQLLFSTLFGGNGAEATQGPGGIAMDSSGNVFVAMDTNSTDLATTGGAFETAYGGGISDGFLAIFQPHTTPSLKYCTYLGLNAQASVASIAVDSAGDAFLAGFTSNPGTSMNTVNGFQTIYGGDPFDGFVMKIMPRGNGASDLSYGTFLGGASGDKALSISVGANLPATAYVAGSTQSSNFPTNGSIAAFQTTLKGKTNAFLSVISQNAITGVTTLAYSSYLGGSETDVGQGVWFAAADQIYMAGTTTSYDFPWRDNFQPFNGDSDAFVTMIDPTSPAGASLLYSTPLGGTAPLGLTAGSQGNSMAVDESGDVYVAGATSTADFPRAANPGNGFQILCASCQLSPPQNDAFVVKIASSAAANPSVSFSSANLNFGSQPVGMPNNAQLPVAIINTGDAPLSISLIGITGANSKDFSAVNSSACFAAAISPGSLCSFEMQFAPSVVGIEGAAVSITGNAPGSPQVLALFGTGAGPLAVPSPASINFGNVPAGTISPSQEITLTNTGNQPLQITNFSFSGNAVQFSLGQNTCTAPNTISAGASCTIQTSFAPSTTGTFNASLNVTDNSGNISGAVQAIPVTGVGTAAAPLLTIFPLAVGFPAQSVGTTSALQTVMVTNQGSATLNISSIVIMGADAGNFGIVQAGSSPCPSVGTLAAGANCTISIDFAPTSGGVKNATLSFGDNASGSPQTVALNGTAVAPAIGLSAANLSFAPQSAGTSSAPQNVMVSNTGSVPLGIAAISLTGPNSADFIETNNCPQSLGATASCLITVKFDPSATGPAIRTGSVSISDNAPQSPQAIALTGTATVAAVSLSAANITFGNEVVATSSSPNTVTVTNTGQGALTVSGVSVTDAVDFTAKNNCTEVAAGGTCTIEVTFSPAAPTSSALCGSTAGAKNATLMLADNATNSPQSVTLAGNATDFCPDPPTAGGNTITVSPGMTATYHLDLTSMGGFAGAVAIACTGSIPGGTCTTSAPSVNVTANGQAPFQVSVTTAGSIVPPRTRGPRLPPWNWCLIAFAVIVVILLGLNRRSIEVLATRRDGQGSDLSLSVFSLRVGQIAQAFVLFLIFVVGMAACGGGGSSGTTATTYSLSVTATAGGTTRSIALTLIIQ